MREARGWRLALMTPDNREWGSIEVDAYWVLSAQQLIAEAFKVGPVEGHDGEEDDDRHNSPT